MHELTDICRTKNTKTAVISQRLSIRLIEVLLLVYVNTKDEKAQCFNHFTVNTIIRSKITQREATVDESNTCYLIF
jgi:hypothetical protein